MAPLAGAKLIADRILSGALTAPQLVRLVSAELGVRWENTPELSPALGILLRSLSGSDIYSGRRISAINAFRAAFPARLPEHWGLVESILLYRSFAWPLLVLRIEGQRSDWTLPLQIKTEIPNRSDRDGANNTVSISGAGDIKCNWIDSLRRARQAAIDLWLHKHGSWDENFKRCIRQLRVEMDLSAAWEIAKPFYQNGLEIELDGRSLETYVSLLVAGALVDRRGLESTLATGVRSSRIPNGLAEAAQAEGADYFVDRPWFVERKMLLAKELPAVDKLLVPAGRLRSVNIVENGAGRTYLDVNYKRMPALPDTTSLEVYDQAQTFSDLADAAFGQRWRRHRYVRCPELSAGFKRTPTDDEKEAIETVRCLLRSSDTAVLRLPENLSALSVAKALYRCARGAEKRASSDRRKYGLPQENTASFVFIRAVYGEHNERFWQTLWNVLDAPGFDEFRFGLSGQPGEVLARQLNWLKPKAHRPQRAPDVIVIVGAKHLSGRQAGIESSPFQRLQLVTIEPSLNDYLEPCPTPALQPELGQTRIVIVPEDWALPVVRELPDGTNEEFITPIRRLSVFQHGFSSRQAGRVLGIAGAERDRLLHQLLLSGLLEKAAKRDTRQRAADQGAAYDARSAEFYVPRRLSLDPLPNEEQAALHVEAAHSITGLVYREDGPVDFRDGLEPENLHQAQWHLQRAWALRPHGKGAALNNHSASVAGRALERLARAGELFGWSRVRWAVDESDEDGREVLDGVEEHLASRGGHQRAHPVELAWSAKLAHQLGRASKLSPEDATARATAYLAEAERGCSLLTESAKRCLTSHEADRKRLEAVSCEFVVRTTRACIQMDRQPNKIGRDQAFEDIRIAREIEKSIRSSVPAPEIVYPEWFEFCGDIISLHENAIFRYKQAAYKGDMECRRGIRYEGVIKYLGAVILARHEPAEDLRKLAMNAPARAVSHYRRVRQLRSGLKEMEHVQKRWQAGLIEFLRLAQSDQIA